MRKKSFMECITLVGKRPDKFDGEKYYISTGALNINKIEVCKSEIVTYDDRPSRANLEVEDGSILFAKMADTKKTLLIDKITTKHIYSTGFCAVKPNEDVLLPKYLFYFLNGDEFLKQKNANSSGATQKAITNKGLNNIKINIPSILEQEKLVEQLDRITKMIKHREEQLLLTDNLVKSRFVEMFGDPIQNELKWKTLLLSEVCESIVDCPHTTPKYTNENTGYMCIRTSIIKKNKLLWNKIEYISKDEFDGRIKRRKPQKGDIVYSREGAILGIAAIIDRDVDIALGQRCMLLSPNTEICSSEFIGVAMNFESFLNKALEGLGGSASPHINVGDIRKFSMIVPPVNMQNQYKDFVQQVDKLKVEVQKSLDETKFLFDSLMQEYFTN